MTGEKIDPREVPTTAASLNQYSFSEYSKYLAFYPGLHVAHTLHQGSFFLQHMATAEIHNLSKHRK